MALELEKFLNDLANNKSLHAIFNNPIYTAFIVVTVVLLIIYVTMMNDVDVTEESENSIFSLMFTSGIYSILAVLGIIYFQHKSITSDFEQKYNIRARDEVISAVVDGGDIVTPDIFNPKPSLYDAEPDESVLAEESVVEAHYSSESRSRQQPVKEFAKKREPEKVKDDGHESEKSSTESSDTSESTAKPSVKSAKKLSQHAKKSKK